MLSRAFSRSIFHSSAKPLQKGKRFNLFKRNSSTARRDPISWRNREFTPEDERVKSFKVVAAVAGFFTTFAVGITAYFVYVYPDTIELKEDSADAYYTWAKAEFPLTLAQQVQKSYMSLSVLESFSEKKVHEKATSQLTIAVNNLEQIDNEIISGKRDRNDPATQEEINQILATVTILESVLAKFAHISKANVDYMVKNNILRNIAYLQDNSHDQALVMLRNGKLLYAINQYAEYEAMAKTVKHYPLTPQSEAFLATPETPLLAKDLKVAIQEEGPKTISVALFGALYCSLAWKILHPRIPKGILMKKVMWAVVGCAATPMIGLCYAQFAQSKTALKAVSDNISGKSKNSLYSSDSLFIMESIADIASVLAMIIPVYYGRFLLFPAIFGPGIFDDVSKFLNDLINPQQQQQQ